MSRKLIVSYLRASRGRTHRSNLELEVQRDLCAAFARKHGYRVIAEYVEIELSKGTDNLEQRRRLRAAIARAKREHCPLVVSHLDRLARNVNFLSTLVAQGVVFLIAGDEASAAFVLGRTDRVVSRRIPGERARGADVAGHGEPPPGAREVAVQGRRVIVEQADRFARNLMPVIRAIQGEGKRTLRAIADALNERHIRTPRGSQWTAAGVRRVLVRTAKR